MKKIVNIPKTARGQKTLDSIVESAEKLFYEKGYHRTSISDITNESDIALGTFYIYFKDKYNLYKFLLLRYSHEIRKAIAVDISEDASRLKKEEIGLRAFLEYIKKNKHVYNIIWESLYIDKKLFVDYYQNFANRYSKGIMEAQEDGEMLDLDPQIMSFYLMGISNFIGLKYVMFDDDNEEDIEEVVKEVMVLIERGMFKRDV
ncbi:MAG: TetR/AcrR family transcriptional regulator [Clostridium sp.]|nr:TetR/AcrR family transcriptional regulator [Clostridium sp.]